jgi:hypothetical protein
MPQSIVVDAEPMDIRFSGFEPSCCVYPTIALADHKLDTKARVGAPSA